ncbi:MAG: hypothetical protein U1D30_01165 [Planctomycetota bacterium]
MRASRVLLACLMLTAVTGCNLFRGYYTKREHFFYGTAAEQRSSKSLERSVDTLNIVLKNHDYSVGKVTQKEESAQIWANKEGNEYVFDLKRDGQGSIVHVEADQAGNDNEVWAILREFELFP